MASSELLRGQQLVTVLGTMGQGLAMPLEARVEVVTSTIPKSVLFPQHSDRTDYRHRRNVRCNNHQARHIPLRHAWPRCFNERIHRKDQCDKRDYSNCSGP